MKTRASTTTHDPFKHLVDFNSYAKDLSDNNSSKDAELNSERELSSLNSFSLQFDSLRSSGSSLCKRKYESKLRVKRDPEALREDSKNRQKNLRKQMKDLFQQLALSIRPPLSPQESTKTILQKSIDYINHLNFVLDCYQGQTNNPPPPSGSGNPQNPNSNPFGSPHSFPEMTPETEREIENILFPSNPSSASSSVLGDDPVTPHRLSFEPPSSSSEIDDLLFFQPELPSKKGSEVDLLGGSMSPTADPFLSDSLFFTAPNKSQKTEQKQSSSQNRSKQLFDIDSVYGSPPLSPSFNQSNTMFSQQSQQSQQYFNGFSSNQPSNPIYRSANSSLPNLATSPSSKQPYLGNFSNFQPQTSSHSSNAFGNQLPPFAYQTSTPVPNSPFYNTNSNQSQLPSFQSIWNNPSSPAPNSSFAKPIQQNNNRVASPTSAFTPSSPSNLYSAYVPSSSYSSSIPPLLKQEQPSFSSIMPSNPSSSFPNQVNPNLVKPEVSIKMDERAVLNAFGKLELGEKK